MKTSWTILLFSAFVATGWLAGDVAAAVVAEPGADAAGLRSASRDGAVARSKRRKRRQKKRRIRKDKALIEAKQHYRKGEQLFAVGEYERALEEYSTGYKKKPLPAFLFNMAQCHRNIGDQSRAASEWDKAISSYDRSTFFFQKYLSVSKDRLRRESIELLVAELGVAKSETEAARTRETEARKAAQMAAAEEARRRQEEAEARRAEAALRLEETRQAKRKEDTPIYERWWFWTIIGAVVVSGGAVATWAILDSSGPSIPASTLGPVFDCRTPPCTTY